jgi:hypothetical protein
MLICGSGSDEENGTRMHIPLEAEAEATPGDGGEWLCTSCHKNKFPHKSAKSRVLKRS